MNFIKCEALGNEFIVLIDGPIPSPELAINICRAPEGPGGDGIIHLAKIKTGNKNQLWNPTVLNCDGTDGGFSGNGLRCGALCILSETPGNISEPPDNRLQIRSIDFVLNGETITAKATENKVSLLFKKDYSTAIKPLNSRMKAVNGEKLLNVNSASVSYLDVGNPHLIINTGKEKPAFTDETRKKLDELRQYETLLDEGINVTVITETGDENFDITTFERGVGLTLSCGSASLAAFITLKHTGNIPQKKSGDLKSASFTSKGGVITLSKEDNGILMTGNVKKIFDGTYDMVNNTYTKN
jgi:diaminopimelate epimerase